MRSLMQLGFLVVVLWCSAARGQQEAGQDDLEQALGAQEYVFHARTALPQRGRANFLDARYDLTVSKDSVVAYLPYFGRAYSAPIGSDKGGIQFTSTDFDYIVEKKKKRRWEIRIRPKDVQEVQE